eukprot:TRINITY_DN1663_c0_g1_i1.p1 TRINITY_DN1663_c0_g1~~TRINITY_DN1663_c0_g1_i1.p1  ORF type:complete len:504 (-),score=202.60 TRINITY_DN1663_c0_g1_i1:120-1631(-)
MAAITINNKMNCLIISNGTRGDVQPYLAFASGLLVEGYNVAVVFPASFEQMVSNFEPNVRFYGLQGDPAEIVNSEKFKKAFFDGNTSEQSKLIFDSMEQYLEPNSQIAYQAAIEFRAQAIFFGLTNFIEGVSIGQRLQIPTYMCCTVPFYPTSEIAVCTLFSSAFSFGFLNRASYWLIDKAMQIMLNSILTRVRKNVFQLPTLDFSQFDFHPQLCLFSKHLVNPKDWPTNKISITGYWITKKEADNYQAPQDLLEFMKDDAKIIYMGFGSMPIRDVSSVVTAFSVALRNLNLKGIFCSGWAADVNNLPRFENIYCISSIPHEWLFPKCTIVIHHGGAGTTAASLRAAVPLIIYPVLGDQPFWATTIGKLGIGPREFVMLKDLNADNLTQQIRQCLNTTVKQRIDEISNLVLNEDGVVVAINEFKKKFPRQQNCGIVCDWDNSLQLNCKSCKVEFSFFTRRHHCRSCGAIFCNNCLSLLEIPNYPTNQLVCGDCRTKRQQLLQH